jgi:FAD/FMN-containing dehydrogenase
MIQQDAIAQLRDDFRGAILEPDDPGFEEARTVYNGMIQRHPWLIAQCSDAADVITAVRFGRAQGLTVSIKGGGHNAGGLGVCDDGLVIDLSGIRYVHVDPVARTVRVGGGSRWGDVDHATHAFGLAVPSGVIANTGVGGLTLGGGLGYLTRKFGLTIDSLLAADVVLADGSFVTASEDDHPDLFWGLRGGGGNFGVVTSFLFQAHPVDTVVAGPMLWEVDQAADIMKWYRDFIVQAPEDMYGFFAFLTVAPGPPFPEALHLKKMCGIVWCYTGTVEGANAILEPIRQFREPAFELVMPMPFPMLQGMFDPLLPQGLQWYWKADFVNELTDEAIAIHVEHGSQVPPMLSQMHLYPINGAAHRVGPTDTPWAYRDAVWSQVMVGVDADPGQKDAITEWVKSYYEALHPYGAGGAYVNFMMDEGDERVRATYRGNYERLAAMKAKYDPDNFFHVNQNIRPDSHGVGFERGR